MAIKLCSVIFCLAILIHQGSASAPSPSPPSPCNYDINDLVLEQKPTGKTVDNKPQWNVTVTNYCVCSHSNIQISCNGFESVEPIDSKVLNKSGDLCTINNGQQVYPGSPFSFTYAADHEYPFKLVSDSIGCS